MSEQREPTRWLDGDELTDDVRRELALYAAQAPSLGSRARMLSGLEQELGLVPEVVQATTLGKLKLLGGSLVVLVGAMGLYVWLAQRPVHTPAPVAAPAPVLASAPVVVAQPAISGTQQELQALAPSEEPSALQAPKRAKRARRVQRQDAMSLLPSTSVSALRSDPVAELALLAQARRALLNEPGHALEFTEVHARDYPHGTFAEEREVLAIEALYRLGLVDEARKRTQVFDQRFANSAQRAHLARMMQALGP